MTWDVERFVLAQSDSYQGALREIELGHKVGHWIWWIFPQLRGLGTSNNATYYGLSGLAEARAYLAHPLLGPRLRTCVDGLMSHADRGVVAVLGADAVKLRSCLTLFARATTDDALFRDALATLFEGKEDVLTVAMLGGEPPGERTRV